MFDFIDIFMASNIQLVYVIGCFVMFFIYRLFLCLSIHTDSKEKDIKCKTVWSVFSFLFGAVVAIIYDVINHKKKKAFTIKSKRFFVGIMISALFLSGVSYITFELSNTGEFGYILNPDIGFDETTVVTFENDKGRKVILDKMGNEYTFSRKNEMVYYDRNGVGYKRLGDNSSFVNAENQEVYSDSDYAFYIDNKGYLCMLKDDYNLNAYENEYTDIYYDDEYLYYSVSDVYWDREGNIVFPQYIDEVNNITYEMVAGVK